MKLDELMKKYGCLLDEGGRYYRINARGNREEPFATVSIIGEILNLAARTVEVRIVRFNIPGQTIKTATKISCTGYNINDAKTACADLLEVVVLADKSGVAIIDGGKYAAIGSLKKILGLSSEAITPRLKNKLPTKKIKLALGQIRDAYNIEQAQNACADLLRRLPLVNEQGTAVIKGKTFVTLPTLTKRLQISRHALLRRIEQAKIKPRDLKLKDGTVRDGYNLEAVRIACGDILKIASPADDNGIATIKGEKYTTIEAMFRLFGLSTTTIVKYVKKSRLEAKKIRLQDGTIRDGYSITAVKNACGALLGDLPTADKNGIATFQGKQVTPLENLGRVLKISCPTILTRIKNKRLKATKIKYFDGKVCDAYDITEAQNACNDLLQPEVPTIDKDNIAFAGGKKYATLCNLSLRLNSNNSTVLRRIGKSSIQPLKIKNKCGRITDAYEIEKVLEICADLVADFPTVNAENIVTFKNREFATINKIAEIVNLGKADVAAIIRSKGLQPIKIRLQNGNVGQGYNIEKAQSVLADLIAKRKPQPR